MVAVNPDPGELVARASRNDEAAWRQLVDAHAGLVWSVARAHRLSEADAADVSQTTWLRLAEQLGALRDPQRLAGWLATTARRESLRVIASRRRELPGELTDGPDQQPGPEEHALTADRDAVLWRSLGRLSQRCRTLLRVWATAPELSYAQLSELLDIPQGSIGPTRMRCLDRLRDLLREGDGMDGRRQALP